MANARKHSGREPAIINVTGHNGHENTFYFEVDTQLIQVKLTAFSNRDGSLLGGAK